MDESHSTIRKVRTFADDIKRAGGSVATPVPQQSTPAAAAPPRAPLPPEEPLAPPLPPMPVREFRLNDAGVDLTPTSRGVDSSPYPATQSTESPLEEATILSERRVGEKTSLWISIQKFIQHLLQGAPAPVSVASSKTVAPTILASEHKMPPTVPATPAAMPPQPPTPAPLPPPPPLLPPLPQLPPKPIAATIPRPSSIIQPEGWKRVSDLNENTPTPQTSQEENPPRAQEILTVLPTPPEIPKQSIKELPAVRLPLYTVPASVTPEVRLQRLADPQESSLQGTIRDIPFIPPTPLNTPTPQLRTYRNDALTDVQTNNLSPEKIAGIERERRDRTGIVLAAPQTQHSRIPLVLVGVFCVMLLGISGTTLYLNRAKTPVAISTSYTSALFSTEKQVTVPLGSDRVALLQALATARTQTPLANSEVAHLRITTANGLDAHASELLQTLNFKAPGAFIRTVPDTIMVGSVGTTQAPFMALKVSNFETAFAGILKWEEYMSIDLTPFFGEPVRRTYDNAALTADHTRAAFFTDDVIQNIDVRILYNEVGEERLLYAFVNPETVVITTSHSALLALIDRLR